MTNQFKARRVDGYLINGVHFVTVERWHGLARIVSTSGQTLIIMESPPDGMSSVFRSILRVDDNVELCVIAGTPDALASIAQKAEQTGAAS